jgi:hypothetical protein
MVNQVKVLSAAVGTAVVVGVLVVGSVGAQTPAASAPWSMREAVHEKVAAALGVPEARLEAALAQAHAQAFDDAVEAGQLTQAQADFMKQRQAAMQSGVGAGFGPGFGMGPGMRGRMGGYGPGGGAGPGAGPFGRGPLAPPAATPAR